MLIQGVQANGTQVNAVCLLYRAPSTTGQKQENVHKLFKRFRPPNTGVALSTPLWSNQSDLHHRTKTGEYPQVDQAVSTSDYSCGALETTVVKIKVSDANRHHNDVEVKLGQ